MNHSDEIKNRLDIVDVLSSYINLKSAGSNFKANCPFHREKTPSLMVSPEKQIWHCFGCGKGGDIFSFVMEMEGVDFVESLKMLAPKAGVVLSDKNFSQDKDKNRVLEILELSSKFYNFILTSDKSDKSENVSKVRDYLSGRGIDQKIISEWAIGYSPDSFDDLIRFLKGKGYSEQEMLKSGMIIRSSSGKHYNRFRNRVMFPIRDVSGRVIAFTARINPFVSDDSSFGKYINSPQTSLYDKSRVLFGMDRAKTHVKSEDLCVLVEGQTDVISSHSAGILNVVASSGTSLSVDQLKLIKRYTNNIVFFFDQDLAGANATYRGVSEALSLGMNLKIANIGEDYKDKDPDELVRFNPGVFIAALKNSKNIIRHYIDEELARVDILDIKEKNMSINKILTVINMLSNKVEQDLWMKELSQSYGVNESFLREDFSKINEKGSNDKAYNVSSVSYKKSEQRFEIPGKTREDKLSELLLAIIISFPHNLSYVSNNVNSSYISFRYRELYSLLLIYYSKKNKFDYDDFLLYISNELKDDSEKSKLLVSLASELSLFSSFYFKDLVEEDLDIESRVEREMISIVVELKRESLKKEIMGKKNELVLAEKNGDDLSLSSILDDLRKLNNDLKEIN